MFSVAIVTGLVVAGILIGTWRNRRSASNDIPNPFRTSPRR